MSNEQYKLNFSGDEINDKLGKIDNKLDVAELDSAIRNALGQAKSSGEFKGEQGPKGEDGLGIASATINEQGKLIVVYTNGNTADLGTVIGASGNNGIDGKDGRGIASTTVNEKGELLVTYTDGSDKNLGNIVGKAGKDGINGIDGETPYIKDGYWWVGEINTNVKAEGHDGTDGHDGTNGTNGISAFEQAKAGGYSGTETEFITALANIIDKRNTTLGLHADGLLYLFVNGEPTGTGVALSTNTEHEINYYEGSFEVSE